MCFPVQIGIMVSPFLDRLLARNNEKTRRNAPPEKNYPTSICSGVQTSRSTDLTLLMWVPIPRWIPEHRIHRNTPLAVKSEPARQNVELERTDSTRPTEDLESIVNQGLWGRCRQELTIFFAVCTNFVLWPLHQVPECPCESLCRCLVLS